ncbi:MAG: hypothetical protein AAB459_02740 [Patescibacteria group bacterium]
MKSRLKNYLLTLIFAFVPITQVSMIAHAEEGTGGSGDSSTTETGDTGTVDPKDIAERMKKRKDALKEKLSSAEESRIKNKCKNSQGKLSSLSGRIKGIKTSRDKVYTNLVDRLTKLSEKIKAKGLDTATLDGQIAELKIKIESFKTDLAAYNQAVSDLAAMDCAADPTAFKAALDEARTKREALVTKAKEIKDYVNNTIKPTLKDLKKQLEDQEASEGSEDQSNEGTGGTNGQ